MSRVCFDDAYSAVATPCLTAELRDHTTLLAQGRDRLRLGDLGGADRFLTELLDSRPDDTEARLSRAHARYSLGRFTEAQRDYTTVVEQTSDAAQFSQPSRAAAQYLHGQAHAGLAHVLTRSMAPGSLQSARLHIDAARQMREGLPLGGWERLAEARVAFESGDVEGAQSAASLLATQHRNDPRAWVTLAEICDARGQSVEAAQAAEQACGVSVGDAADLMSHTLEVLRDDGTKPQDRLQGCLMQLQARSGRLGFSIVLAKLQASGLTPAQETALLKAAASLPLRDSVVVDHAGMGNQALLRTHTQWLSETAEPLLIRTADPAALSACAIAALRLRGPQWQQTFDASFDLLLQRCGPLGFWTLITKAEQAIDTPRRVAQLLEAAAAINPDDRMTHLMLLRVQSRLGEVDRALLEVVQASRPSDSRSAKVFLLELEAETAKHDGNYQAAITALDALCLIAQEPRFYALRANLKLALWYLPADVKADCATALSYDNFHYLALYTSAQQDLRTENFSAASKALQLCRTKYPNQPDPLYVLGEIATSQGMSAQAIAHYKAYLEGSFPIGRLYEDDARLALAQEQLNTRDYAGAIATLVQVDQANETLHQEAQKLRTLVVMRQGLHNRGVHWWASLPEIEALIDAKQYDKALASLFHHGAQNARNVYSLALRARVHFEMGNFAQAEADAQMAQDIDFFDSQNESVSARLLSESQAHNASIVRTVTDGMASITRYFRSWP